MKRRGSALIFVIAMVFSITSMVVVTAAMNRSVNQMNESVHRQAQENLAMESSEAYVNAMADTNAIALNNNYTMTLGGQNYTVKAIDNASTLKQTYAVSAVGLTRTKTTSMNAMTGARRTAHPSYYALWAGNNLSSTGLQMLDTNNEYGFVYGNNVNISLLSNLKSDLIYKTSSNISTLLYAQVAQGAEEWFPFTSATYDAAAPTLISTKNQTNLALGAKTGAYYNAFRATASLNLDGTISGNGILIVDGDLTIKNNLSYGSATDRCVFLVTGNLTFAPGVTQAVGHFYVTGGVTATTTSTLTIPRGSIACNGNLTYDRLDITADPYFLQNQDQCEPYRLPGFWPVTDSRLNRP